MKVSSMHVGGYQQSLWPGRVYVEKFSGNMGIDVGTGKPGLQGHKHPCNDYIWVYLSNLGCVYEEDYQAEGHHGP